MEDLKTCNIGLRQAVDLAADKRGWSYKCDLIIRLMHEK
jgi:hypothetical protein